MSYCAYCGTQVENGTVTCPACGKPASGAAPAPPAQPAKGGLPTAAIIAIAIVVLFVVVAVIGIIAAIAIPNFLTAKQRAMQKKTMADLRTISTAVEAYAVDNMYYPEASSIDELAGMLEPFYLPTVPRTDAWGRPYSYACWPSDPAGEGCESYRLASLGRDGILDFSDLRDYEEGLRYSPIEYDRDIVFGDGRFVYYPDGMR